MMYFLTILFVFLLAYGVSSKAVLAPRKDIGNMLTDIIWQPYFNIYGELFVDREPENNSTTRFGTDFFHSYSEPVAWLFLGGYLLIANVLLLNLLIAIFNNTFTEVQANSEEIWKFNRYDLILENLQKPPFIPPLTLLTYTCNAIYLMYKNICNSCCKKVTGFPKEDQKRLVREALRAFEVECMATLSTKQGLKSIKQVEQNEEILSHQKESKTKITTLNKRIIKLEEKLTSIQDEQNEKLQNMEEPLKKQEGQNEEIIFHQQVSFIHDNDPSLKLYKENEKYRTITKTMQKEKRLDLIEADGWSRWSGQKESQTNITTLNKRIIQLEEKLTNIQDEQKEKLENIENLLKKLNVNN